MARRSLQACTWVPKMAVARSTAITIWWREAVGAGAAGARRGRRGFCLLRRSCCLLRRGSLLRLPRTQKSRLRCGVAGGVEGCCGSSPLPPLPPLPGGVERVAAWDPSPQLASARCDKGSGRGGTAQEREGCSAAHRAAEDSSPIPTRLRLCLHRPCAHSPCARRGAAPAASPAQTAVRPRRCAAAAARLCTGRRRTVRHGAPQVQVLALSECVATFCCVRQQHPQTRIAPDATCDTLPPVGGASCRLPWACAWAALPVAGVLGAARLRCCRPASAPPRVWSCTRATDQTVCSCRPLPPLPAALAGCACAAELCGLPASVAAAGRGSTGCTLPAAGELDAAGGLEAAPPWMAPSLRTSSPRTPLVAGEGAQAWLLLFLAGAPLGLRAAPLSRPFLPCRLVRQEGRRS